MKRVALASGIELDVIDVGPSDAPTLIFLHGFPESHRTWRHQIAHFCDRYRCVAPDQRGYRSSSKPAEVADYAPQHLIGDVFQLADALDIARFTVIGHDWGGALAWGVAAMGQFSGRVTSAVIANAPHPVRFQDLLWTDPAQRASSQYIRTFRDTPGDDEVRAAGLTAMLDRAIPSEALMIGMEPELRQAQLAEWSDGEAAIAMLNWYRASPLDVPPQDAPLARPTDAVSNPFPCLTIPALVIWGMADFALLPANLDALDDLASDLTIVKIDGCGHFSPWQAAERVTTAIANFLD